jgi:hypothetical protein
MLLHNSPIEHIKKRRESFAQPLFTFLFRFSVFVMYPTLYFAIGKVMAFTPQRFLQIQMFLSVAMACQIINGDIPIVGTMKKRYQFAHFKSFADCLKTPALPPSHDSTGNGRPALKRR